MDETTDIHALEPNLCARLFRRIMQFRIGYVEPVVFIYYLYFGGINPVTNQFITQRLIDGYGERNNLTVTFSCGLYKNDSQANYLHDKLMKKTAEWNMYNLIAFVFPAFFSATILGGYSDQKGRKPVILLPLIGSAARLIMYMLVQQLDLHIGFIVLGSFLDGMFGGLAAIATASFSYLADTTDHSSRSLRMVVMSILMSVGGVIASIVTGVVLEALGYLWVFILLLVVISLSFLYSIFLKESLERISDTATIVVSKYFAETFKLYLRNPNKQQRWCLTMTLVITLILSSLELGRSNVEILYIQDYPFCFGAVAVGIYTGVENLVPSIAGFIATKFGQRRLGDLLLLLVGIFSAAVSEILFGVSVNTAMLFIAPFVGCLSKLNRSMTKSFNSKIISPDVMGAMFSSIIWAELLGICIGSLLQSTIYTATIDCCHQVVFITNGASYLLTSILVGILIWYTKRISIKAVVSINEPENPSDDDEPLLDPGVGVQARA